MTKFRESTVGEMLLLEFRPLLVAPIPLLEAKYNLTLTLLHASSPIHNNSSNQVLVKLNTALTKPLWHLPLF